MANVAVVRGGRSLEREMSMRSGYHVANALRSLGHEVVEADVDPDLMKVLESVDVAFVALHGRDGEDGTIQLACEAMGVRYTGSGPLTCRLCFDKGLAKGLLLQAGLPTPPAYVLSEEAVRHMGAGAALRNAASRLGFPLVLKPAAQGSALGLAVVKDASDLSAAAMAAFDYGDRVILEAFVDGKEISVPLLGADLEVLPAIEIQTPSGVFDFATRVSPGAYDFLRASSSAEEASRRVALEAAKLFGVRDFGRVDMRISEDGPVILDVKTCPGLTETSIVPMSVAESGRTFEDFVQVLLEAALERGSAPARQ